MRVLLVEDEPEVSASVKKGLQEQGYAVDVAQTGEQALDWIDTVDFDLVVLDLMIPAPDGLMVCRTIRQNGKTFPVLMLTARDAVAFARSLEEQSDRALGEPFSNLDFAGEATSQDNSATVHGAYLSGLRAAAQLRGSSPG